MLALVANSHILISRFADADVFPFYTWELFDTLAKENSACDISLKTESGGQISVLRSEKIQASLQNRRGFWAKLRNICTQSASGPTMENDKNFLRLQLASAKVGIREAKIIRIRSYIMDYITGKNSDVEFLEQL